MKPHTTLDDRILHTRKVLDRLKRSEDRLARYLATLEEQRRKSPGWCYTCGDWICHENPKECEEHCRVLVRDPTHPWAGSGE